MKSSNISSPKILSYPFCGNLTIIHEPGGKRRSKCNANLEIDNRGECTVPIFAWSYFVWNTAKGEVTKQEQTKKKDSEK